MREFLRGKYTKIGRNIRHKVSQGAVDYMVKAYGKNFKEKGFEALRESMGSYLESLNVQPDYIIDHNANFAEHRTALNTKAGLAIANHPAGFIDVPMLLNILHRPDFKAYVLDKVYRAFVTAFEKNFGQEGKELIMNKLLTNSPTMAKTNFRTAITHIKNGGLLVMHPTAGEDRHSTKQIQFRPGFRLLLKYLEPEHMVYSFCFNPHDMTTQLKGHSDVALRFTGMASEQLTNNRVNINRLRKPVIIRVDERYSTATEWQNHAENDLSLTEHYWAQYKNFTKGSAPDIT
jgi:hypothetical protein